MAKLAAPTVLLRQQSPLGTDLRITFIHLVFLFCFFPSVFPGVLGVLRGTCNLGASGGGGLWKPSFTGVFTGGNLS